MTLDETLKVAAGTFAALTGAALTWLVRSVLGNRETISTFGLRIKSLEASQVSKEDVRQVVEQALDRRAVEDDRRRQEHDALLAAQVREAVSEGTRECRSLDAHNLERLVPRIVHETLRILRPQDGGA